MFKFKKKSMKIAVVMGGYSKEYQISLKSGEFILKHFNSQKYILYAVVILKKSWYVKIQNTKIPLNKCDFSFELNGQVIKFDIVFNTIHGSPGEDGQLQAYWSLLGIPFSGCGFYQSALTFNKKDTLAVLSKYHFTTPKSFYLKKGEFFNYEEIVKQIGIPFIVKPNQSGSSLGISKVNQEYEFENALKVAFQEDEQLLFESFLKGIEVSVGVFQYFGKIKVIGITEIISENDFFDYEAKYSGKSQEITPARISQEVQKKIEELSTKAYKILSMSGFARIDFIIVNDIPHIIEINTNPGFSEQSIFPKQVNQAGLNFSDLLDQEIYRIQNSINNSSDSIN